MSKTSENTLSIEITSRFWFKRVGNFLISKNMHFLIIFRYLQISFAVKYFGVDQVLTKILQIDQKLTFNVFHISNQYRISKIEKNIWWHRPPPQKKAFFLGGASRALKAKDLGYVSDRKVETLTGGRSETGFNFSDSLLFKNPRKLDSYNYLTCSK